MLDGEQIIQLRDRNLVLGPRELFVVPRGVEHCPRADREAAVLLLEPLSVTNTGDSGGERPEALMRNDRQGPAEGAIGAHS